MKGWERPGGQSATRAPRHGTKRSRSRLCPALVTFLQQFISGFRTALVWFAAWALILQGTLVLCAASASAGVLDPTSAAVICHTSSDTSDDSSTTLDPGSKQCSQCPLCVFGRGVTMPQTTVAALPVPMVVTIAIERIEFLSPHLHVHDLPVARGPPTTA